jgi:hypothetical protein
MNDMNTIIQEFTTTLIMEYCCECGIPFGITKDYRRERRGDHKSFYCPSGHKQYFPQKSDEEILKQELHNQKNTESYLREANASLHNQLTSANYSIRAHKAAKTKILNRVKNGVCPCCNRQFQDLQQHFQSKHPELFKL